MVKAAGIFHLSAAVPVALAFVLGLVGLGVQLSPWPYKRVSKWAAALCYIGAAEIALGLVLPHDWFFYGALPLGALALIGYAVWLWRASPPAEPQPAPNQPAPTQRTGVKSTGTTWTGSNLKIRNQDLSIDSDDSDFKDSDVDIS